MQLLRLQAGPRRLTSWIGEQPIDLGGQTIAVQYQHDEGEVYLSQMTWGPIGAYQPVTTRRLKIEGRSVEDAVDLSEK